MMNDERYIILKEAEEQFKIQQKGKSLGVPELTHREKVNSIKSAKRIIESAKMGIHLMAYRGILFVSTGLTVVMIGDAWIGGWSRLFWLSVVYGACNLLLSAISGFFMYKNISKRPERVFIEQNGQAVNCSYKNYGFQFNTLKIGSEDKF